MKLLLVVSGALGLKPFFPEVGYRKYVTTAGVVGTKSRGAAKGLIPVVRSFVETQMGFKPRDYVIKDFYESSSTGVSHVYLRQKVDGKEVFNGDINVNVKNGVIVSYGDSFYRCARTGVAKDRFPRNVSPASQAMGDFLSQVGIEQKDPIEEETMDFAARDLMLKNISKSLDSQARAQLGWIQSAKDGLVPVWDFQVELQENYYHGHISTDQSQMLALADWRTHTRYRAAINYASDTSHPARVLITDPHDPITSPLGWHNTGYFFSSGTLGNNAAVMYNNTYIIEYNGNFDYNFDPSIHPSNSASAAVTNLFYWINKLHDLFYHYGFNERAGNFQTNNFGRGGQGDDAVLVYAQDEENFNNAFFTTPPDGQAPRMHMHLFDNTDPHRDSSFDQSIIIHEYCHGLSNRLTGGPANSDCLNGGEPGGLGEGWGDFIAVLLATDIRHTRHSNFGIGAYSSNSPTIRTYLYSTNLTVNPDLFSNLALESYQEVHEMGQIWAVILYEIYWNLRDKLGFTDNWFQSTSNAGNTLMLQLVIDAIKLQPCRPTFIEARDALLQAEQLLTRGFHACELWRGFAKRGLGLRATSAHKNSFEIPYFCFN